MRILVIILLFILSWSSTDYVCAQIRPEVIDFSDTLVLNTIDNAIKRDFQPFIDDITIINKGDSKQYEFAKEEMIDRFIGAHKECQHQICKKIDAGGLRPRIFVNSVYINVLGRSVTSKYQSNHKILPLDEFLIPDKSFYAQYSTVVFLPLVPKLKNPKVNELSDNLYRIQETVEIPYSIGKPVEFSDTSRCEFIFYAKPIFTDSLDWEIQYETFNLLNYLIK